jgi:hypothetical protein
MGGQDAVMRQRDKRVDSEKALYTGVDDEKVLLAGQEKVAVA